MFTRETPYKTETSDWAKWLKMSFTLCKLGKSLYDKSLGDAYGAVKDLYDQFKEKEDANYTSYISQPFLTSAEQDSLIDQLREQRFFDLFQYSAQRGSWICVKCGKRVQALKQIEKENSDSIVEGASPGPSSSNSNTMVHGKDTPAVVVEKIQSHLKVSVGFMKRITKVWCILEADKVIMLDKDKKEQKHTLIRKNIIDVKDLDTRVTKRENSFSIITRDRTYQACAATPELKASWKKALNP